MELIPNLTQAFMQHPLGLCSRHDPAGTVMGVDDIENRLGIVALGSVIDINPLSQERWSLLVAIADHWLLEPGKVAYQSSQQVRTGMDEVSLLGQRHIARVWWQISRGVQGRFKGSWRELISANNDNAQELDNYLRENRATFPVLAGPVVAVRWLDLIHRVGGVNLKGWEDLRLPLTGNQKKTALLLGNDDRQVHPMMFQALSLWITACKKLPDTLCGFDKCPRK
jgi:hypothetical protein